MQDVKLQFLQEELKRVSEWIRFADQKVAFLAIYYSALISFVIVNKDDAINKILLVNGYGLYAVVTDVVLVITIFSLGVAAIIFTVFPKLKNQLISDSLLYYGTISNMKFIDFKNKINVLSDEEVRDQIIEQIYTNSNIASQKMRCVKDATVYLIALAFFMIAFVII